MEIGQKIKAMRKKKRMTQMELSKATGISQSSISDIENQTNNPSYATLKLIADALNCSYSELIGESSDEFNVSPLEKTLIIAFRQSPAILQKAILDMLHIESPAMSAGKTA